MNFWTIGFASFLTALSGAMMPGPVLTYTISKSIEAKKKAYLVGIFICFGHALLELILMILLLTGIEQLLSNEIVKITIGLIGGSLLLFFAILTLRDLKFGKIDYNFLELEEKKQSDIKDVKRNSMHPIIGGILISMSNPYWWLWWAGIGFAFTTDYGVSLSDPIGFWGFFIGHQLGDILWYVGLTIAISFSHNFITKKVYIIILIACNVFMIYFAFRLAILPLIEFFFN
ncbi:MAG: LysE family transporter [archaeon]|nr:LysE family transporter [archaeon]